MNTLCFGTTGTRKDKLMLHQISEDIKAKKSVLLIDLKGDMSFVEALSQFGDINLCQVNDTAEIFQIKLDAFFTKFKSGETGVSLINLKSLDMDRDVIVDYGASIISKLAEYHSQCFQECKKLNLSVYFYCLNWALTDQLLDMFVHGPGTGIDYVGFLHSMKPLCEFFGEEKTASLLDNTHIKMFFRSDELTAKRVEEISGFPAKDFDSFGFDELVAITGKSAKRLIVDDSGILELVPGAKDSFCRKVLRAWRKI